MSKHTPGPWYASKSRYQGLVISETAGANVAVTYEPGDADLVAAAPDLFYALEKIIYAHDNYGNGASMGEALLCPHYAQVVRAALNKAKGL